MQRLPNDVTRVTMLRGGPALQARPEEETLSLMATPQGIILFDGERERQRISRPGVQG